MKLAALHRTRTARYCGVACLALLGTGCGSSGSNGPADMNPWASAPADSARIAEANQRILTATPSSATPVDASSDGYRVGRNDRIRIDVFGAEMFSGEFRVEETGEISYPLLGGIPVEGNTPRELEALIESRLRETYMKDPRVSIQVVEVQSHGVSVIGAVNSPGVYQVTGRSTLLEVLALAQGLTETAGNTVHVLRANGDEAPMTDSALAGNLDGSAEAPIGGIADDPNVVEVDLGALLDGGPGGDNIEVLPGDIVQVRPAGLVYVVGEVNRPGGFTVPSGGPVTVLQALAMAEGLGRTASASSAFIVRQGQGGARNEIPVDLEEVLEGSAPPPSLLPRDVLFVPSNRSKAWALGIVNALVGMFTFRGLFY